MDPAKRVRVIAVAALIAVVVEPALLPEGVVGPLLAALVQSDGSVLPVAEDRPPDPFPLLGHLAGILAVARQEPGDVVRLVAGDHVPRQLDRLLLRQRPAGIS